MFHEFSVQMSPELSVVTHLSKMVDSFGDANGLSAPQVYQLNLALDELINNVVSYGLRHSNKAEHRIYVDLQLQDTTLILRFEDDGMPFDPMQDTHPDTESHLDDRAVGGLGLFLVKSFAERMSYRFAEGRNQLVIEHDFDARADDAFA